MWGKLTDHDLNAVAGKSDQLLSKIQERPCLKSEKTEKELKEREGSLK
jgi:uncharacterized protein YjbJ (UPF0337 family)